MTQMKYLQACYLKKQLDMLIGKLSRTMMGSGVTKAARKRLVVAHVSAIQQYSTQHKLILSNDSKTWWN